MTGAVETSRAASVEGGEAVTVLPYPRYAVRNQQVFAPGFWRWVGPEGHFVQDRLTGANVTASILDPFLPAGSPFLGRSMVSARQAMLLAALANDPDGAREIREHLMSKLAQAGGGVAG